MGLNIQKTEDHTFFIFEKEITIAEVSDLKENVLKNLDSIHRLTINLEQVEIIDVAGLQLLCATNRSLEKHKQIISVETLVNKDRFKPFLIQAGYDSSGSCHESPCTRCLWKEKEHDE